MDNKVIISAALTGGQSSKEKNPNVPITPEEIAESAHACWEEGAAIVHLHMRDDTGKGTMDRDRFDETIKLIRAKGNDLIINCSNTGERGAPWARRMEHFKTVDGIEIGSYDIDTMNWGMDWVFENPGYFLRDLADVYSERGIKPEIEVFDEGMLGIAKSYVARGIIQAPAFCQFVLGVTGGMAATMENLHYLVSRLPEDFMWSCTGIGSNHLPMMYATLALGGNIRVGLEDNLYYGKGILASNQQLVARAVRVSRIFGKEPATPSEARAMLGLKPLLQ